MLPQKFFENLHSVVTILALFEILGRFCLKFGSIYFAVDGKIAFRSILPQVTSLVFKCHFVLDCHDFSIVQWIECSIYGEALH